MELMPYSEDRRDEIESQLAAEANKRELLSRRSNGINVIAYYLVEQNITTIWVEDERTDSTIEFPVPPGEVMAWFEHPFAHPDANLPTYEQRENDQG